MEVTCATSAESKSQKSNIAESMNHAPVVLLCVLSVISVCQ